MLKPISGHCSHGPENGGVAPLWAQGNTTLRLYEYMVGREEILHWIHVGNRDDEKVVLATRVFQAKACLSISSFTCSGNYHERSVSDRRPWNR